MELIDAGIDSKKQREQIWVVLASSCGMRYINKPQYLHGEKYNRKSREQKPREASLESEAAAVKCIEDCTKQQTLQAVTLENISGSNVLSVGYRMK